MGKVGGNRFAAISELHGLADRLLAKCSRITSGGTLIPELDGMRFFAIVGVILFHCIGHFPHDSTCRWYDTMPIILTAAWNRLLDCGWFGVELFFVISGFILALPFARHYLLGEKKPALGKYFLRRLTRLEPPYVIQLLIHLLCLVLIFKSPINHLLSQLGISLIYSHQAINHEVPLFNPALWSLEVEVYWYTILPLFAMLYKIHSAWLRRALMLGLPLLIVVLYYKWLKSYIVGFPIAAYLPIFAIGAVFADLYVTDWKQSPIRVWYWDVVALASAVLLYWQLNVHSSDTMIFKVAFHPACLIMLYLGVFKGRLLNALLHNRWLVTIGGMCYTLYLYQFLVLRFRLFQDVLPPFAYVLVNLAACIIVGAVLFVYFEKPFMRRDWHLALLARIRRTQIRKAVAEQTPSSSPSPESDLQPQSMSSLPDN